MTSLGDGDITESGLALGQFAHGVTLRELTDAYTFSPDYLRDPYIGTRKERP